jgi:hypothetical protein
MFAVRKMETHGKHIYLPCVFLWRTAKTTNNLTGLTSTRKKMFAVRHKKKRTANYRFAVRQNKNARQTIFLPGVFFYRAPWKMRTAKLLFAVRPKICARQRLKRTAIIIFPVVLAYKTVYWFYEKNGKKATRGRP